MRIGVAGEFAGHGLLAIAAKDWLGWISQMIQVDSSTTATVVVNRSRDLIVALIVLAFRPVLLGGLWGFWTALSGLSGAVVVDLWSAANHRAAGIILFLSGQQG